jgi:tetratricopeptide (TPR) repeat protein
MLLPNIHSNLGSAYFSMGELAQAREHFEQALSLNPGDSLAQTGLQKIAALQAQGQTSTSDPK